MPELSTIPPELSPDDKICFTDEHRVSLTSGDYEITVTQDIKFGNNSQSFEAKGEFSIQGERFSLNPQTIHAVFPPEGSQGDFWHVLPHVILNRSTLPWERSANQGGHDPKKDPPWLLLLLFDEQDAPATQVVSLKDLAPSSNPRFPGIEKPEEHHNNQAMVREKGQHDDDQVMVIDLPASLCKTLVPQMLEPLKYLTHARWVEEEYDLNLMSSSTEITLPEGKRLITIAKNDQNALHFYIFDLQGKKVVDLTETALASDKSTQLKTLKNLLKPYWDSNASPIPEDKKKSIIDAVTLITGRAREELAVITGNRLPKSGSRNVVHLVSIEGRYKDGSFDVLQDSDRVRFISLMSWEFFCISPKKNFKGLLEHLNKVDDGTETPASLRLPEVNQSEEEAPAANSLPSQSTANSLLSQGYVPLPHFFRQGDRSVSLYRGPLVPNPLPNPLEDSDIGLAQTSDHLLKVYPDYGLLDVSYAMAWELGRMLTLQNTRVALQLFNWKRQHAHDLAATRHLVDYGYGLPMKRSKPAQSQQSDDSDERQSYLPEAVQQWFDELSRLHHIPFNYLIADDRLLPPESLHFFSVDNAWLNCLRDGAFSVGRVLELHRQQDSTHTPALQDSDAAPQVAGLLLRSEVVSGWPGLQIDTYSVDATDEDKKKPDLGSGYPKLPCLRMERLSNDVLIALFDMSNSSNKSIQMVDIHLRPETLHFGFDVPDGNQNADLSQLTKKLRSNTGDTSSAEISGSGVCIDSNTRIVDVTSLAKKIFNELSAAHLSDHSVSSSDGSDTLGAHDFALQMVVGVEMVRFIRQ